MNKKFSRILSILLVITMLMGIAPITVLADFVPSLIPDMNYQIKSKQTVTAATYGDGSSSTTPSALMIEIEEVLANIADSSHYKNTSDAWKVMDLARYGITDNIDKNTFVNSVRNTINSTGSSVTDLEKMAIALTAIGEDAIEFDMGNSQKINLIEDIKNHKQLKNSVNSLAFGILAMFAGEYVNLDDNREFANGLVEKLLTMQIANKGWSWNSEEKNDPDIDTTAMVLAALAPYYINADELSPIKNSIDNTIQFLKEKQTVEGGFASEYFDGQNLWVTYNSNTTATVALGLIALGVDPNEDVRFIKNVDGKQIGIIDALMSFKTKDNFFDYMNNEKADIYATEQAFRTLVAYKLFIENGKQPTSIYYSGTPTGTYTVSKDSLGNLINEANSKTESAYTNISWGNFTNKLTTAQATYNNETATPTEITKAYHDLIEMLNKLELVPITQPSDNNITVNFSVGGSNIGTVLSNRTVTIPGGSTVEDVIVKALNNAGISFTNKNGYISEVNGIEEFSRGPNSGWAYYVNGVAPSTTGIRGYILTGNERIELKFINDYTTELEYSGGGTTYPKQDEKDNKNNGSEQQVVINKEQVTELIKDSYKTDNRQKEVVIKVEKVATENTKEIAPIKLVLPADALKTITETKDLHLKIESEQVLLSFDPKSLAAISTAFKDDKQVVSLVANPVDREQLTTDVKKVIGDRPVYDFEVIVGENVISDFAGGEISITLPYDAKTDENTNALVVYYIDDNNKLQLIKNSTYDKKAKLVKFSTNHFSSFGIGYNEVNFDDVNGKWMQNPVEYMAAREIVRGIDDNRFLPDREITRAEFVTLLMRMLENDLEFEVINNQKNSSENFDDVNKNSYYYEPVLIAKKAGLVSGIDGNHFNPNGKITRQEMFTIVYRAIDKYDLLLDLQQTNSSQESKNKFSDMNDVASYALVAIEKLAKNNLVKGDNGKIKPLASASRAEATQFLFNIYTVQNLSDLDNEKDSSNEKLNSAITVEQHINETAAYLQKTVTDPTVASIGGEWTIISLARSNVKVPKDYFDKYETNLRAELDRTAGKLHHIKYTEYDRVILALTALGKDAGNYSGYNLIAPLEDVDTVVKQGLNGAIWALIALDSANYQSTVREKLIDYILSKEVKTGGWSLASTEAADVNTTAMVLQAFANYQDNKDVKKATNNALEYLAKVQSIDGNFKNDWDTETNSETLANVIVAYAGLGKDPKNEIAALLKYYQTGGGFKHTLNGQTDLMATDQGLYALVAYERFLNDSSRLYDMSDVR